MSSAGTAAKKHQERFHGAFTGGFSAGYFNSVGSAEGWTPSSFSSSRDKRAAPREQRPEDFMDDEDGLLTEQLQAKLEFDSLGSTAAELARSHAEKETVGGTIPGPAPSELIVPVGDPMGKKLLRTMGWREGQGVGSRVRRQRKRAAQATFASGDEPPEEELPEQTRAGLGEKAKALVETEGLTFAPTNTNIKAQAVVARTSLHGVGHDPFQGAPEFCSARGVRIGSEAAQSVYKTGDLIHHPKNGAGANAGGAQGRHFVSTVVGRGSHGFFVDDGEDDVYEGSFGKEAYDNALDAGGDQILHSSFTGTAKAWALGKLDGEDAPAVASRRYARCPSDGRLPLAGFVVAQQLDGTPHHWEPPIPPANFNPIHRFEEEQANPPLRICTSGGKSGMNALGRARLLGEPSDGEAGSVFVGSLLPSERSSPLPAQASVFSLLSSAARKSLQHAAHCSQEQPIKSHFKTASGQDLKAIGASGGPFVARCGAQRQEGAVVRKDETPTVLTTKFTPERLPSNEVACGLASPVGGVDPAVRPSGLTVSTPAVAHAGLATHSAKTTTGIQGQDAGRNPVRSISAWRPAPLLCKRLNVPVPPVSAAAVHLPNSGLNTSQGASAIAEGDVLRPLRQFVVDSSAVDQVKVPLLEDIEQRHPFRTTVGSGSPGREVTSEEHDPGKRPTLDLFKSIFESRSDSESESEPESDGEGRERDSAAIATGTIRALGVSTAAQATGSRTAAPSPEKELVRKSARHRGYGSESSEESLDSVGGEHWSVPVGLGASSTPEKSSSSHSLKARGRVAGELVKRRRARGSSLARDELVYNHGELDCGQRRSGSKRKHKKEKSAKKHKKYHKRKHGK